MRIRKGLVLLVLFVFTACGQAGWKGYYETYPKTTANKYIAESAINSTPIFLNHKNKIDLELPRDISTFMLAGFFTPFTPPVPIIFFRSWDNSFFTAETKPAATLHLKTIDSKTKQEVILESTTAEGSYGYTKHIFPIKAKNLDSGTLIIEKDGQKTEVPFEYKYFKFWY